MEKDKAVDRRRNGNLHGISSSRSERLSASIERPSGLELAGPRPRRTASVRAGWCHHPPSVLARQSFTLRHVVAGGGADRM